ncbi:TPA: hypothetical protein RJN57_000414 [Pseudomonas aeruginosa]|nr:hypothetical protein [Pseudomonas aeruginosa]HDV6143791.1 hypothetical protein [Pseudomonas aeruginosa]HDV6167251.1 hypothetical protein [Pseudomonas aeruginosa]
MSFNRNAFCNPQALEAAAYIVRGETIPHELRVHEADALAVHRGINQGYFSIPKGKNRAYSKAQFAKVRNWLSRLEILSVVKARADALENDISSLCKLPLFEVFGSYLNDKLPCPFALANNLTWRCPRLPFEFKAGAFGASEYCDVVEDLHSKSEDLLSYIDLLSIPGFLSPETALKDQAELLRKHGKLNLLPMVVRSIHKVYLGRDEERKLNEVVYGGCSVDDFTAFLTQRKAAAEERTRETWSTRFHTISQLAGVLAETRSYHQASLTRLLRKELNESYRVICTKGHGFETYCIQIDAYLPLGSNSKLLSTFELVNWVIALDEATKSSTLDVYGFWSAVETADQRIERLRLELAA